MVEQDVEALLGVCNVLLVLCWSLGLHALQVCLENFINGTGCLRNVRSITGGYYKLV